MQMQVEHKRSICSLYFLEFTPCMMSIIYSHTCAPDQNSFSNLFSMLSFSSPPPPPLLASLPPFFFFSPLNIWIRWTQWSQKSTCPPAPRPSWTGGTRLWWPPASRSEDAPPRTSFGSRGCAGGARRKPRTSPTAPAPRTCATCGSRRATRRGRR